MASRKKGKTRSVAKGDVTHAGGMGSEEIWSHIESGTPGELMTLDEQLAEIGHSPTGHKRMRIRIELAETQDELNDLVAEMAMKDFPEPKLREALAPRIKSRLIALGD